jgi:hypothetical protein
MNVLDLIAAETAHIDGALAMVRRRPELLADARRLLADVSDIAGLAVERYTLARLDRWDLAKEWARVEMHAEMAGELLDLIERRGDE